jgi:twitching motility protein PilT
MEQALEAATSPHDFKLLVAADGRKGTTMQDVAEAEAAARNAPAVPALR